MVMGAPPERMHSQIESLVRAGIPLINTVGAPGTQGATMAGTQGTGTPRAAMTSGLAGELHNPNVAMFSSGYEVHDGGGGSSGGDDGALRYDDQRHRGLPHRAHDHGPFDDELTHRCHLPGERIALEECTPSPARPHPDGPEMCPTRAAGLPVRSPATLHEGTGAGCLLSLR